MFFMMLAIFCLAAAIDSYERRRWKWEIERELARWQYLEQLRRDVLDGATGVHVEKQLNVFINELRTGGRGGPDEDDERALGG